jgi:hypothetical protein
MARRYIPPIPLEILMDNPKTIALSTTGLGALVTLAWRFWTSDCAPLPTDRLQLFALSGANRSTWGVYRDVIMSIMADAMPEFAKARELREKRKESLAHISKRGVGSTVLARLARAAKREQAKQQAATASESLVTRVPETIRAARVVPPVKSRIERGFSDRRIG